MRIRKTVAGIAGGLAVAAIFVSLFPAENAEAARRRRGKQRGTLKLVDVNVGEFSGIPMNHVIEFTFTQQISQGSLDAARFQIRAQSENGGFTKQVAGDFQLYGNRVRFYPRLPTHLRDPNSVDGSFYGLGEQRDDADFNAGLQPLTNHEILVVGHPSVSAVRTIKGRKLNRDYRYKFTTAPESPKTVAYSIDTYTDAPPPGFHFSNPPDKVANVDDQYALHGGTRDVPNDISVTLFGNRVPLSPDTVRQTGNVSLVLLERGGDTSVRKPIQGSPFLEQNYDTTRLVYVPRFPLPDVGTYALRVTKDVRDLTNTFTFKNNAERLRLREIYDFLDASRIAYRQANPGEEPEPYELPDPEIDLIYDWPQGPQNAGERAVLKGNVLALGDAYPDEVDPRAMVIFSTRNEPVSDGQIVMEFTEDDGLFDADISTAQWDDGVPGAVAAISTIAGGTAADGDYEPAATETISFDDFTGRTINWRRVHIPHGVAVRFTGTRPGTLKAIELLIDGEIHADGLAGGNGSTGSYVQGEPTQIKGGKGGPGGGAGADSHPKYSGAGGTAGSPTYELGATNLGRGLPGNPGIDAAGAVLDPADGGRGGIGGTTATGTYYRFGGGGGGGGSRTAGTAGTPSTGPYATWNGSGGAGGAGSNNADLDPLGGGAGGASGGNSTFVRPSYNWNKAAGGGGGGGGALLIQTATTFTVGTQGVVRARGGRGGNGTGSNGTLNAGPGGGGGGGALLLRSTKGFSLSNPGANTDVSGGSGGSQSGNYVAPSGGVGGFGYVRLEDPNSSGPIIPGGTVGEYNPVGGGEPSIAYSRFIGFGVEEARMVNPTLGDFDMTATSNDAVLIEIQFAIEDPQFFGLPKTDAIDVNQDTTDDTEVTIWMPVRVIDRTGIPGGAFGPISGQTSTDQVFEYADMVNGKDFKFFRCRYTFQLDDSQGVNDIFPNVARQIVRFQFNF